MKIFKTKTFNRWQRKEKISDSFLYLAIQEMLSGLIDAELGNYLFKKRIAKPGFGKRSSYRTIVASKINNTWFFIYGFSKNEKDNISEKEEQALVTYSQQLFKFSNEELEKMVVKQIIFEVNHEQNP